MNTETRDQDENNLPPDVRRPRQTSGGRRAWAIRWLVVVLLLAALAGILVARIHSANQAVAAHSGLSATAVHAGQIAPDFTLQPVNSPSAPAMRLSSLRGHAVVINFWSPTCAPCHDEAPILARAAQQYAGRGVVFLGVAFESARADVVSFMRQYHIAYPCGLDSSYTIATAYGLLAIPVTVVVDRAGAVARVIQGAVSSASLGQALRTALDQPA